MYICQCYSLSSSHPLFPVLCPQVCSLCTCSHCHTANRFISTVFLDSICMHYYMILFFSFWHTSLCIKSSRFITSLELTQTFFFFLMAEWYYNVYMYHNFFIHLPVGGHLGCFHVLAFVRSAAMNSEVHVFFWVVVFSRYMPSSGTAGSHGSFIPIFSKKSPYRLYRLTFSPIVQEGSFFSTFVYCTYSL